MIFMVFLLIAIWQLPLPLWLQICLTVFGSLKALCDTAKLAREN